MRQQGYLEKLLLAMLVLVQLAIAQLINENILQIEETEQDDKNKPKQQEDDEGNSTVVYILLAILGGGFLFFLYNTWRCHRNRQIEEDEQEFNKIEFQDQKEP